MTRPVDILCIGAAHWDIIGRTPGRMAAGADLPGRITRTPGGVAMNIALALCRFGLRPALLTALGRDAEGDALVAACAALGLNTDHIHRAAGMPTDRYLAIEGANGLVAAIADGRTLEAAGDRILRPLTDGTLGSAAAPWAGPVALDGNLTEALLAKIAASPALARAGLRVAPASNGKAARIAPLLAVPGATFYVNLEEAEILAGRRLADAAEAATALLDLGAARVLVTDGARGVADGAEGGGVLVATPPPVPVARVTGAGDSFMAAHIAAEIRGAARDAALCAALDAAARHVSGEIGS